MAADVIKTSKNAVLSANDEERLSDEIESKIVPRVCGLANMTDNLPGRGKELGFFGLKGFSAEIERRGQSGSASDVAIGMELKIRHERSGVAHSSAEEETLCGLSSGYQGN
jgi:hypothetical protein